MKRKKIISLVLPATLTTSLVSSVAYGMNLEDELFRGAYDATINAQT